MNANTTFSVRITARTGVKDLISAAQLAESSGFDQVWTGNDLFGRPGLVNLAAIAANTSRILIGSAVIDPVSVHPAQIAMFASGMQDLSDGRFLLGLGAGSDHFFSFAGLRPEPPAVRTRKALLAIRALVNGGSPADVAGSAPGWTANAVLRYSHPVPIYVGGLGPRMLELTGRFADGALALCTPPEQFAAAREQISRGAESAQRTLDDLDLAACVWVSISDDRETARTVLAHHIAHYSGSLSTTALEANGFDPEAFARVQRLYSAGRTDDAIREVSADMLRLGIAGTVSDVIDRCAALHHSGITHLSFGPPLGAEPLTSLRLLGTKALPELRRLA